jgi:hypothetical protein
MSRSFYTTNSLISLSYIYLKKLDLREIGIDGENWIQLAQERVRWWAFVNTVMYLRAP